MTQTLLFGQERKHPARRKTAPGSYQNDWQAGPIEARDTDKTGVLRAPPGAAADLDGTQEMILDQITTPFFNRSVIGGVVGSFTLWFSGF